jgi:hypothetical protein
MVEAEGADGGREGYAGVVEMKGLVCGRRYGY